MIQGARHEMVSSAYVGIGTGSQMILTQSVNIVLRKCRIGRIWPKTTAREQ